MIIAAALAFLEPETLRLIVSAGLGVLVAVATFPIFFGSFGDFFECVRLAFQPDMISLFRGEFGEDQWGTMKLIGWLVLAAVCGFFCYFQMPGWLPDVFANG